MQESCIDPLGTAHSSKRLGLAHFLQAIVHDNAMSLRAIRTSSMREGVMRKAVVIAALLAITVGTVFADVDVGKGKWLHDKWVMLQRGDVVNPKDLALYDGFIIAVAQVAVNATPCEISIPQGTTLGQMFKAVGSYMDVHPEVWNLDAGAVVIRALKTAYSLKK